ncbi:MAG: hypothetical protein ABS76_26860 [Pelagibacterium sp. SCN 64-44]|nr:MAG: hypothetical protein ABS76_26860 [Pelagibacterium sp. SCN 64-44]
MSERSGNPYYRSDIDGLRALAIIGVLVFHAFPQLLGGGYIGVDVFFVISGFLIGSILARELDQGKFDYLAFLLRRVRRLLPAMVAVLLAGLPVAAFLFVPEDFVSFCRHILAGLLFFPNLLLWSETGYTDPAAETKPLLHLWSLGIEGQFYLFWPLVLLLAWRLAPRYRFAFIAAIAGCSLLACIIWTNHDAVAAFYLPVTRFWELAVGTLVALLLPRLQLSQRSRNVMSLSGAALIVILMAWYTKADAFPGWRAMLPVLGSAMLIATGPQAWLNRRLLSHPVMVTLGLISYPLYLWHWLILTLGKYANLYLVGRFELSILATILLVGLSIVLAYLTHRFIERPYGRKPTSGAPMRLLLVGWAGTMLLAGGLWATLNGFGFGDGTKDSYLAQLQRKDGTCFVGESLAEFRPDLCIAPADGRVRVLLVGDSFGAGFSRSLNEMPDLAVSEFTASSCPFNPGLPVVVRPEACAAINAERMRLIETGNFDVIFIASWWGQQEIDGQMENLASTMERILADTQSRIVVYGPSPVFYSAVPDIYRRNVRHRSTEFTTEVLTINGGLRDTALTMLPKNDRVHYIDAVGLFCDPASQTCTYRDEKDLFFIDNSHLSLYGTGKVLAGDGLADFLNGREKAEK